jgi:hypothetical protein
VFAVRVVVEFQEVDAAVVAFDSNEMDIHVGCDDDDDDAVAAHRKCQLDLHVVAVVVVVVADEVVGTDVQVAAVAVAVAVDAGTLDVLLTHELPAAFDAQAGADLGEVEEEVEIGDLGDADDHQWKGVHESTLTFRNLSRLQIFVFDPTKKLKYQSNEFEFESNKNKSNQINLSVEHYSSSC